MTEPCIFIRAQHLNIYYPFETSTILKARLSAYKPMKTKHIRNLVKPAKPEWTSTLENINQCKAVISVDTAVAHLAAGSGKTVHMLLGDPPDWRWRPIPEDRSAPLWYPNITIEKLKK